MTSLEKAKNIAKILDKKKAIDIIGIETKELTVMSDYFIIASGTSNTHVRALADADFMHVTADRAAEPHRAFVTDHDIAHHGRRRRDKDVFAKCGKNIFIRQNGHI